MPHKQFQLNEILTSADTNNYLMEQAVATFTSETDRDQQYPAPNVGALCYITSSGPQRLQRYDGSRWLHFDNSPNQLTDLIDYSVNWFRGNGTAQLWRQRFGYVYRFRFIFTWGSTSASPGTGTTFWMEMESSCFDGLNVGARNDFEWPGVVPEGGGGQIPGSITGSRTQGTAPFLRCLFNTIHGADSNNFLRYNDVSNGGVIGDGDKFAFDFDVHLSG